MLSIAQKVCFRGVIMLLTALMISGGCKTSRRSRSNDRISHNFELYMQESSTAGYDDYSRRLGYELNGDENTRLLDEIVSWLGTPYLYGGITRKGADCSGFVKEVYKAVYGVNLYRSTSDMVRNGRRINNKHRLREADLVFFRISGRNISHVGIYISNNYFAHASSSRGVVVDNLDQRYYADRFAFGGRVLTD